MGRGIGWIDVEGNENQKAESTDNKGHGDVGMGGHAQGKFAVVGGGLPCGLVGNG